ncbi:MAG: Hsp20/alpha crystallin family protein [Clostridia bacterium]|nr:Hsp20/alpha crystallin family protein [Clostridia bacterium]
MMFELTRRNNNHQATVYNPFRELEEFERRFFGDPFGSFFGTPELAAFKTDVIDEGDHYLLEADLPGFEKKDIQLDINGDTLSIHAERHSKVEEKEKDKVVRVERSYGSYSRQFDLSAVDSDRIKATYENGVLKLILPKKELKASEGRRLEIE